MPSIKQLPSGKYRAQLYVGGQRDSRSFRTLRDAKTWAATREVELREEAGKAPAQLITLGQVIEDYLENVTPSKLGHAKEEIRLRAMLRMLPVDQMIGDIDTEVIKRYRDERLRAVKPNSVLRELGSLSAVFEDAKIERRLIETNPVREISKPAKGAHRRVLISLSQIRAMLKMMGYSPRGRVATVAGAVAVCFLAALRTGCRAGELCDLRWTSVGEHSIHVASKTDAGDRDVPTTQKTRRVLDKMRGFDPLLVFGLKVKSLDAMFRKYRDRAGLSGFTFHDSRHTAATWLVKYGSLNVLELCKIMGWTDPKMAMIYFNPTALDLLARMVKRPS